MRNRSQYNRSSLRPFLSFSSSAWQKIECPGLTPGSKEAGRRAVELAKMIDVFRYKNDREVVWVIFVGGTGTGKSTIFNALCGRKLSETGVERPKTQGALLYVHENVSLEEDFPFSSASFEYLDTENRSTIPRSGKPEQMIVMNHHRKELAHVVLVDTPDVDSVEVRNRETVEDLYLLADVIVFVASQEKYADDVPFQFLLRILEEGKTVLLVLNKWEGLLTHEEVKASFEQHNMSIPADRFWMLPYLPVDPSESLHENEVFKDFADVFFQILRDHNWKDLLQNEQKKRAARLRENLHLLIDILDNERKAAEDWLTRLDAILESVSRDLFERQQQHFNEESQDYLKNEIRELFSRYDLLQRPRRFISQLILSPFRLLGFGGAKPRETRKETLLRIREKIDLAPIEAAVESFNRSVLEKLSPTDEEVPLFVAMRAPELIISRQEIKEMVWKEQDRLSEWLENTFNQLAKGIPKSKEWGIYSTSLLWGALILAFETAIGGGISILEAALDSALAPFVTKGAVELFAYQEIQKIARELAQRYQDGLLTVIRKQRDRYIDCLQSLMTPSERVDELRLLLESLGDMR